MGRAFSGGFLLAVLVGCSNVQVMRESVRAKAVGDFSCPRENVTVSDLRIQVYGARGCDMKATYTVTGECTSPANCKPVLNPASLKKTN